MNISSKSRRFLKWKVLTTAPVPAYLDPIKKTIIEADSMVWLDVSLKSTGKDWNRQHSIQENCQSQNRYTRAKKCLASVWACERFGRYLIVLESFNLCSDHKPLVLLINSKDISRTTLKCQSAHAHSTDALQADGRTSTTKEDDHFRYLVTKPYCLQRYGEQSTFMSILGLPLGQSRTISWTKPDKRPEQTRAWRQC